ncbi:AFL001Wp [Eremothecium gossypii ATCC 10895]|uniref:Protein-lysine N-methyltransferase EFM5 n=1 Tax=Eremothecium gossypii (strain ATCC 10895 / CBS 109.51 / FGSC 9923 / NRRL Y-1056) TaxID=284811 RepID=Q754S2_EREGS|nr:AFL001Wp [Eremothecium gossypii ATCC 10895]AAS53371.1 AFL001Wp [Eremothecium gossypii ATCC 10895]
MSDSDSDLELQLSSHALAALQEFRQEEEERQKEFERMYNNADEEFQTKKRQQGMELFKEDWQLSQFWYNEETANTLAKALLDGADEDTCIAVVSAPSVYAAILKLNDDEIPTKHIYLLEFDKRFELLAGTDKFLFYDYSKPLDFDSKLKGKVDRLLIDPPFLNEHCQTNSSITAKALLAPKTDTKTKCGVLKHRLISCTGERMRAIIKKNYPDTEITTFLPEHMNGLSNEFRCYANFEWDGWSFSKKD